ncbi:MAG: hypothetical protein JRF63_03365 [Deltaproteobacteria bacterium]|nr:hypothetical protein [Deltaproteobacteria bacterium]
MRWLLMPLSIAVALASCANDVAEADRRAEDALKAKQATELETKERLMAEERVKAADRNAEMEEARRREAEAGQEFAVGPIIKGEDKDPAKIVERAVELMGGREKVAAVKTLTGRAELSGAVDQAYDFTLEYPDKMVVDFLDAKGQVNRAMLVNGAKAYNITRGKVTEFVSPMLEDTLLSIRGDPLCLMITLAAGGWGQQITYLGQATVAGKRTDAIRIAPTMSKEIIAFFDAQTSQLIATRYEMAQGLVTVIDEQFEPISGVKIGVVGKQIVGSMISTVKVSEIEINPALPKGRFDTMQHPLIR